jgi:hypothetical protein
VGNAVKEREGTRGSAAEAGPTGRSAGRRAAAIRTEAEVAAAVRAGILLGARVRETGSFLGEGQERITLGTAHAATRVLAQEEDHKGEHQAQADDDGEWNDGHDVSG